MKRTAIATAIAALVGASLAQAQPVEFDSGGIKWYQGTDGDILFQNYLRLTEIRHRGTVDPADDVHVEIVATVVYEVRNTPGGDHIRRPDLSGAHLKIDGVCPHPAIPAERQMCEYEGDVAGLTFDTDTQAYWLTPCAERDAARGCIQGEPSIQMVSAEDVDSIQHDPEPVTIGVSPSVTWGDDTGTGWRTINVLDGSTVVYSTTRGEVAHECGSELNPDTQWRRCGVQGVMWFEPGGLSGPYQVQVCGTPQGCRWVNDAWGEGWVTF